MRFDTIDTRKHANVMRDASRPYAVVMRRGIGQPFVRVMSRHETERGAKIAAARRNEREQK